MSVTLEKYTVDCSASQKLKPLERARLQALRPKSMMFPGSKVPERRSN
jgi:hypothetical protein